MQIFKQPHELQEALQALRFSGQTIGLVPTMGNLHEGHLALVDKAKQKSDFVVASIFVNPLQFGPDEYLDNYPRTLESDIEKLTARGCDGVFVPSVAEMFPEGTENQTCITVPGLSEQHCGLSRPDHFSGVCTVVNKLFNLTRPDLAFFGEKDYQQLQIIRRMTSDLCMNINIIGVPTIRSETGLALSSRNNYLEKNQISIAASIYQCLEKSAGKLRNGEINYQALAQDATEHLLSAGLKVDYYNICHALTLEPATRKDQSLVILAAAWLGPTRLIDNVVVLL